MHGKARRDDDDESDTESSAWKIVAVLAAIVVAVLIAGLIVAVVISYTSVWTNQVRSPVNHRIDRVQNEVNGIQDEIELLQEEIDNLPDVNGSAISIQLPDGQVLLIENIDPGQLLARGSSRKRSTANQIIGLTPNESFIVSSLGFTPENAANRGVPNGYASLNASGVVPASQLPPQTSVQFFYISSSVQLPTLTSALVGDFAIIENLMSNSTTVYVLSGLPPTNATNWVLITQTASGGAYVVTVQGPGSPSPLMGPHVNLTNQDLGYPYQQGGNAFGATGTLGLIDQEALRLIAGNYALSHSTH